MRAEQDFDLSLLSEAALAEDPIPDQSLQLDVVCSDDTKDGAVLEHLSIRTTPRQMDALVEQYRALRYTLIQRAQRRAEEEVERERGTTVAFAPPPEVTDPVAERALLVRVRDGLERKL